MKRAMVAPLSGLWLAQSALAQTQIEFNPDAAAALHRADADLQAKYWFCCAAPAPTRRSFAPPSGLGSLFATPNARSQPQAFSTAASIR
jgi:hypothetical protein